jgi:hypothetical protein
VRVAAIRLSENRFMALSLAITGGSTALPVVSQPNSTSTRVSPTKQATEGCSKESDNCPKQSTPAPSPRASDDDDDHRPDRPSQTAQPTTRVDSTAVIRTESSRTEESRGSQQVTATPQATKDTRPDAGPTATRNSDDDHERPPTATPAPTQRD